MYIQQLYTNCLAHAAYYIESGSEAAVIDPLRDTDVYIELAGQRGAKIRWVFETHFHADFVSGHLDLAKRTGAAIVFGPDATPAYEAIVATDGQLFPLGNAQIKVLHTPGHTIESACYLAIDEAGSEKAVFTGDTLFVGDVGRPDLLSGNLGKEELAAMLFESLNKKIKTLPDDVTVYPGHGPGSACGKNIGKETFSAIGEQKRKNYALLATDKDDFIRKVSSDLPAPPPYFFEDAAINKNGYRPFGKMISEHLRPLSVAEFEDKVSAGAQIIDTRDAVLFGQGYIRGAINIGLNGDFAVWVGTLVDFGRPLVLVTQAGSEKEAVTRLARIGYEHVEGYLEGSMSAWLAAGKPVVTIPVYGSEQCEALAGAQACLLLDVRKDAEYAREKLHNAVHIPLSKIKESAGLLSADAPYLIYCAGGYRSMIAASILNARGFTNLACVAGGINEVKKSAPWLVERT